jgi:hypothetical protein
MTGLPENVVRLPSLCERCRHDVVVNELGYARADTGWMTAEVTYQLLLFQRVAARDDIREQCGADPRAGTPAEAVALSEAIGSYCLRCLYPAEARLALIVSRKGVPHAAQVAQGKIDDPDHLPLTRKKP